MAASRLVSRLSMFSKNNSRLILKSCQHLRHASSGATCTPGQWQLVSAVCLHRPPVISAKRTRLEERYAELMEQMELENSLMSEHELRAREDEKLSKKKQAEDGEDGEVEGTRVTALDLEDAWEAEAKLFTPASRRTEADVNEDDKSTERKLDQSLVLLTRQKLGPQSHWVFPQGPRQDGESMRQAAERVLSSNCGEEMRTSFLGNAPCGFHQYRYPPTADVGTGAKVFFFKAWYQDGAVVPNETDTTDYKWVSLDELPQYCSRSYLNSVREFLIDL